MLLALAEELLVSCAQVAIPNFPVLVVPVLSAVAAVACAVAGASCLRVAVIAVLNGEVNAILAKVSLPLPVLTTVALGVQPGSGGAFTVQEYKNGKGIKCVSTSPPAAAARLGMPDLPAALRDALVALNDSARELARQLSPRAQSQPCGPLAIEYDVDGKSTDGSRLRAFPIDFDAYDSDSELSFDEDDAVAAVQPSPLAPVSGPAEGSAVASLGADEGCPAAVKEELPDACLIQFGAMIGEQASIEELQSRRLPWAWGSAESLFGVPDSHGSGTAAWELVVSESSSTASYQAWRRPLRKGYYMWKSRTVIQGVTPAELSQFNLHNRTRFLWDDTALMMEDLEPQGPAGCKSKFQQYRCRYPTPLAAREYVYARRVWDRSDGGCYVVSRACGVPEGATLVQAQRRTCRVGDYVSCLCMKASTGEDAGPTGGAEVVSVYFEDPSMPPRMTTLAIRNGLWPFVQKHEAALRQFALARRAAHQQRVDDAVATADGSCASLAAAGGGASEDELEAGLLQAVVRRQARSRGPLGVRPLRALRPLVALPTNGALRSRLVLVFMLKLVHGVVASSK